MSEWKNDRVFGYQLKSLKIIDSRIILNKVGFTKHFLIVND
jgi:hypothetical protein